MHRPSVRGKWSTSKSSQKGTARTLRATGTMGVLGPTSLEFDDKRKDIRIRGIVSIYAVLKWKSVYAVLRSGCLYQYNDPSEKQMISVMPLHGAKLLDLGQTRIGKFAESNQCAICKTSFTTFNRRHHCRACFRSCCANDASEFIPVPASGFYSAVRSCINCSRICVSYLESLPLSLDDDVSRPNPAVFTLPLQDRHYSLGLKSRAQEIWFSVRNREEAKVWIKAIEKEGVEIIRPPEDLLESIGKVNQDQWKHLTGKVSKLLLKCKTDDELYEASLQLSSLEISAMKPETRSIIRDIRAHIEEKERKSTDLEKKTSESIVGIKQSLNSTEKMPTYKGQRARRATIVETDTVSPEPQRHLGHVEHNRSECKSLDSIGITQETEQSNSRGQAGTTGGQHQRRKSAFLRREAAREIAERVQHGVGGDTDTYQPGDEVFMLDEKGRVKRTAEVVKTLDENTYEVKSGHKVSKILWKKLFRVPKVSFAWKKGKTLGEGQYGVVYAGFDMDHGTHIAIKQMPFKIKKSKKALTDLFKEVKLMQMVSHPNIVKFIGCQISAEQKAVYIFMEQVSGGSLQKVLLSYGSLSENVTRGYTKQILNGLEYLHLKGVVHRDLKCANVLITTQGVCKLADFGVSKQIKDDCQDNALQTAIGSPYWMAPEVILEDGYGRSADIWSLGCTIIEMSTAQHPWRSLDNPYTACYSIAQSQDLPYVPPDISKEMRTFILACLQRDKEKRPLCSKLWKLEWLKGVASPSGEKSKSINPSLSSPPNSIRKPTI